MCMYTYDEFDDIDGGKVGAKSRDAEVEAASEELFGFFLTVGREVGVHTGAAMHSDCPPSHNISHSLPRFLYLFNLFFYVWRCFCDFEVPSPSLFIDTFGLQTSIRFV